MGDNICRKAVMAADRRRVMWTMRKERIAASPAAPRNDKEEKADGH